MAAPVWDAKGSDFSDSSANPSFGIPAGTASGKIVIVSMFVNVASTTVDTVPSGFSPVPGCPVVASNHFLTKYWKRLTAADSGTYDFVLSTSTFLEGVVELYSNCIDSGSPFDAGPDSGIDETAGSISPTVDLSTAGPDRLIIHSATCWAGGTWTSPTGFSKRVNPSVGLITTSDKSQSSLGSTGSLTATTTTSDKRTAHVVALIGTTVVGDNVASISDTARANMLADRGLSEPQTLSNADLMRAVLADGAQTLIEVSDRSVAGHLDEYLIALRNE